MDLGLWVIRTQGDPDLLLQIRGVTGRERGPLACQRGAPLLETHVEGLMSPLAAHGTVEHGSCFSGVLAELLWAVDRSYMMEDEFEGDNRPIATITLSNDNFGTY